jgi:hypothetical protein
MFADCSHSGLHSTTLFYEQLLASLLLFADYLDANDENGGTAT